MRAGSAIDVPMEMLPFVDEHSVSIAAPPEAVWDALIAILPRAMGGKRAAPVSRVLGCEHTKARGEVGVIGTTIPGFVVSRSVRPACLGLLGAHRYSRYALIFRIDDEGGGRSRLRAETRAEFPGAKGRVYRALVIGSRGHVLATRRVLAAVKKRAERG